MSTKLGAVYFHNTHEYKGKTFQDDFTARLWGDHCSIEIENKHFLEDNSEVIEDRNASFDFRDIASLNFLIEALQEIRNELSELKEESK